MELDPITLLFASWPDTKFCQQSAGRTLQSKRGLFFQVLLCSCLPALMTGSTQQDEGHSMAPNLQQGSAEWLWVASQKILLVPQLSPLWMWDRCQQEAFQQVLLIPSRQLPICQPRLQHQWTLSSFGPEPHLFHQDLNRNLWHRGRSRKLLFLRAQCLSPTGIVSSL